MDRSTMPYSQAAGSHHHRSLSQPSNFFFNDSLPPLSPSPCSKASPTSSISDSADPGRIASGDGLPPRKIHRRSCSELSPTVKPSDLVSARKPEGNAGGEDLFDVFFNLGGFGMAEYLDYFRDEMVDKKGNGNSKNGTYSSESEAESCAIDCAVVTESSLNDRPARLVKGISMDGLNSEGRINFCEGSHIRVSPSPGSNRSQSSECVSVVGSFSLEFGRGEFSGVELKKIMADKRLEEIALADPKRAKRILANRFSAARSKERKVRYISELESKIQTLQTEATTLSTQLTLLQRDSTGLASQNNELKDRLQAMEQQAHLRDALNEALGAEVRRLRLATTEFDDSFSKLIKQESSVKS